MLKFKAAVKTVLSHVAPKKDDKAAAGGVAKPKKKAAGVAKDMKRVYSQLEDDADKLLKTSAPPEARIWSDVKNGRWRLSWAAHSYHRRSVSWTQIGSQVAALVALRQVWDWSMLRLDKGPPEHVENLLRENGH